MNGQDRSEALLRSGQEALERGDFARAVADFSELTRTNPRAPIAWCGRAAALYGANDFGRALAAARRAIELSPDDARGFAVLAPAAFALGDDAAISACTSFIKKTAKDRGRAIASFWAQRLAEKDFFHEAARAFDAFALDHSADAEIAFQRIDILLNAFRIDDAEAALQSIEAAGAPDAGVAALYSRLYLTRGDIAAAAGASKCAIAADADCVTAYGVLAELEPRAIDETGEAHLAAIVASDRLAAEKRIVGGMALGRAREARGDVDGAFAAFSAAKALAAESLAAIGVRHDPDAVERAARRALDRYREGPRAGEADGAPPRLLFIIGMPRSGSTLIDQILSRHSAVRSVGESLIVPRIAGEIERAQQSGRDVQPSVAERRAEFRAAYRKAAGTPALVIDKNLFNFQHCGLIADLDPGARFILSLREPRDIALSVFRTKFMAAHAWSNSLDGVAHMIACFELLTDGWRRVLGDRLFVVEHEKLVADLESGVAGMLDFCGLPIERACLDFHKGERAVFTQSAAQVRRPVNQEGVGRWRRYERHLDDFAARLDDHRKRLSAAAG